MSMAVTASETPLHSATFQSPFPYPAPSKKPCPEKWRSQNHHDDLSVNSGTHHLPGLTASIFDSPNDVLLDIFLMNSHLDFRHPHHPSRTTRRTSQIFSQWRELALSYPSMWAEFLDFGDPLTWLKEAVSCTQAVPVNVVFPSSTNYLLQTRFMQFIQHSPMPYLRTFSIDFDAEDYFYQLPTMLFNNHAPRLREIMLSRCNADLPPHISGI